MTSYWAVGVAAAGALVAGYTAYVPLANPEVTIESLLEGYPPTKVAVMGSAIQAGTALVPGVPAVLAVVIGGMPLSWLGLGDGAAGGIVLGAAAGIGLFAAAQVLIYVATTLGFEYEIDARMLAPDTGAGLAMVLPLYVVWATAEEFVYRAAVVGVGAAVLSVSPWPLVVAIAVVFGVGHLPNGRGSVLVAGVLGVGFGAAFVVGGFVAAATAHVVVNVLELVVNGWFDASLRPDLAGGPAPE